MMRALLLAATAVWLWAAPVQADPVEFGVDLGNAAARMATKSGTALLRDTMVSGGHLRVHGELAPRMQLGLDYWHPQLDYGEHKYEAHVAQADVAKSFELTPFLLAHARVGAGVAWQSLQIANVGGQLQGDTVTPMANAAAGLALVLPRGRFGITGSRWLMSLGFSYELGWMQMLPANWTVQSARDLSPQVAQSSVDLGSATLCGVWQKIAVHVRF